MAGAPGEGVQGPGAGGRREGGQMSAHGGRPGPQPALGWWAASVLSSQMSRSLAPPALSPQGSQHTVLLDRWQQQWQPGETRRRLCGWC